jgi:hypothetical protein
MYMKKLISGVNKYNLFAFSVLANPGPKSSFATDIHQLSRKNNDSPPIERPLQCAWKTPGIESAGALGKYAMTKLRIPVCMHWHRRQRFANPLPGNPLCMRLLGTLLQGQNIYYWTYNPQSKRLLLYNLS